jgi:hypothetical protein
VIARPRVFLPRLLDIPLRHLCREFHAFANPRTEPRPMRLDEFSVVAPDLARLDHAEGLAPAVKTIGSHAAASGLWQGIGHVVESCPQQHRDIFIRLLERIL